jgi:hypothetical protein
VRVVDKVRHRRQHEGETPVSCVTGGEHGGKPPARCGTGGEHAAASASWWRARGEGVGGASLVEASGDDGNWCGKMALAAIYTLHR